jgi:DNA-binding transcriptional ArsR family regulator
MPASTPPPDRVFGAIADPIRRELLAALRAGPRSVARLAARFPVSRPAISKHLRILREADLVRVVGHGRENHYALNAAPLREVDRFLADYRAFWTGSLARLKRHVEREGR